MNNFITDALGQPGTVTVNPSSKVKNSGSFKNVMARYIDTQKAAQTHTAMAEPVILVGEITTGTPTVSDLLIHHKELGSSTWDIINSEQNRDKDYTKIQPGTRIYFDRRKGTLNWSGTVPASPSSEPIQISDFADTRARSQSVLDNRPTHSPENIDTRHAASGKTAPNISGPAKDIASLDQQLFPDAKGSLSIGTIDSSNPTVSHLLKNHPQLKQQTWNLLASSLNKDKPFDRIARGTEIFINPDTKEITWNGAESAKPLTLRADRTPLHSSPAVSSQTEPSGRQPVDLSEAVQKYMGTSYDEINCYELLVKGLHQMDIPYSGKNGLFSKLTRMAVDKGMAPNAYLNGEGIIKAAGSLVLSKNYSGISDWKNEAAALIKELEPLLNNGQILSFSTEKRGHTGVVSQKDKQWTFINSGRLDNSVNRNSLPHGVGEETLSKEIGNWFRTAHANRETLSVTLGRLSQGSIRTALNLSDSVSKQI